MGKKNLLKNIAVVIGITTGAFNAGAQETAPSPVELFKNNYYTQEQIEGALDISSVDGSEIIELNTEKLTGAGPDSLKQKISGLMEKYPKILPKDFNNHESFQKSYKENGEDFYKSKEGQEIIKLKKDFFKGKYEYFEDLLTKLKANRINFENTIFCNDDFRENPHTVTSKNDYISEIENFLNAYKSNALSIEPNLDQEAMNIWAMYENTSAPLTKAEINVDCSNLNELTLTKQQINNINFKNPFYLFHYHDSYTLEMTLNNGEKLRFKNIQRNIIENLLRGIASKETTENLQVIGANTTNEVTSLVYESPSFFGKLIEDTEESNSLKDFNKRIIIKSIQNIKPVN